MAVCRQYLLKVLARGTGTRSRVRAIITGHQQGQRRVAQQDQWANGDRAEDEPQMIAAR